MTTAALGCLGRTCSFSHFYHSHHASGSVNGPTDCSVVSAWLCARYLWFDVGQRYMASGFVAVFVRYSSHSSSVKIDVMEFRL